MTAVTKTRPSRQPTWRFVRNWLQGQGFEVETYRKRVRLPGRKRSIEFHLRLVCDTHPVYLFVTGHRRGETTVKARRLFDRVDRDLPRARKTGKVCFIVDGKLREELEKGDPRAMKAVMGDLIQEQLRPVIHAALVQKREERHQRHSPRYGTKHVHRHSGKPLQPALGTA